MSEEHQEQVETKEQPEADDKVQAAESKARELGWVPKSEWRGDPEVWTDAATWMEKGDKLLGSQLRKAEGRISDMQDRLEKQEREFADRTSRLERMQEDSQKRLREQLESDFEARIRKAAETGDTDAVNAAIKDRKDAVKKLTDAEAEGSTDDPPQLNRAQTEWLSENAWFGNDKALTRWANTFADDVEDEMPAASEKEKLQEIASRVRERFPDKFGGAKRNGRSRVEGGSRVFSGDENGDARGKQFSKLPPEAKEQFNRDVKAGLYKEADREPWAERYFS